MKTIYHRNSAWWGDSTIIVIEGGKGIAKVSHDTRLPSNKAYISDIMVLESSRNKGLGNLLLFLAEEECKKMGAKYAVLDVEKDSFASDWYTKKGYRTFGEDTNLYYMEKAL